MAKKQLNIKLEEETLEALKAKAAREDTTATGLVTELLEREYDPRRTAFLQAAAEFNTPENWALFQEAFGPAGETDRAA